MSGERIEKSLFEGVAGRAPEWKQQLGLACSSWKSRIRCMDYNAALCGVTSAYLFFSAFTKPDAKWGLPCFIFYNRVFQLLVKIWCGCYIAGAEILGYSELECQFLFRWFMLGGVLDNNEIQAILELALQYCERVPVRDAGWCALEEFLLFASQHGRLEQHWGDDCIRWIRRHRLHRCRGRRI